MNAFSQSVIENFGEPSNFFPSNADLYHPDRCMNSEAKLRCPILNTDFDSYSDFSDDASSTLSLASSEYAKWNIQRKLEEARMHYGHFGVKDSSSASELTNVNNTPRLSDAEMTELFLLEEQEKLEYLAELVHQNIVAADIVAADYLAECHSVTPEKASWKMEPPLSDRTVFLDKTILSSNNFSNEDCLNAEQPIHRDKICKQFFKKKDVPVSRKSKVKSKVSKKGKTMGRPPKLDLNGRKLNTPQAPKEVKEVKPLLSSIVPQSRKQKKDNSKANAVPFSCDSKSISNADQKVFLGGLPLGITEKTLRWQMAAQGYKVLKRPKILRGFAPEVQLMSAEQAKKLVTTGKITIGGFQVEVRPYKSSSELSKLKKIPIFAKRSISLRGLSFGTTVNDLKDAFNKLGMKVLNYPIIKDGFSRQVLLKTITQAKRLIKMKNIMLNGKLVEVEPFVEPFVNHYRKNRNM